MASEQDVAEDIRHAAKMAKKKAARDRMMAEKSGEKGLIIVHTGAGKGKSSSAFGMILRCVAHGFPCAVVQFIKGAWETGERRLLTSNFSDLCQFHTMGEGFTWERDRTRDMAARKPDGRKRQADRDAPHGRSPRSISHCATTISTSTRSRLSAASKPPLTPPCLPAQCQKGADRCCHPSMR